MNVMLTPPPLGVGTRFSMGCGWPGLSVSSSLSSSMAVYSKSSSSSADELRGERRDFERDLDFRKLTSFIHSGTLSVVSFLVSFAGASGTLFSLVDDQAARSASAFLSFSVGEGGSGSGSGNGLVLSSKSFFLRRIKAFFQAGSFWKAGSSSLMLASLPDCWKTGGLFTVPSFLSISLGESSFLVDAFTTSGTCLVGTGFGFTSSTGAATGCSFGSSLTSTCFFLSRSCLIHAGTLLSSDVLFADSAFLAAALRSNMAFFHAGMLGELLPEVASVGADGVVVDVVVVDFVGSAFGCDVGDG